MTDSFDVILVGSSFASSFFLQRFLRHQPKARVLVLERGQMLTHQQHGEHAVRLDDEARESYVTTTPWKTWRFRLAFGGSSNCWLACTPRLTPSDFRLKSLHGQGVDWPIQYDDLEPYYCDVEETMSVSGPLDGGLWRRSRPYPQPPHRLATPDRLLHKANPQLWFEQPAARPTRPTEKRLACCATGICWQCPVDSKFTVLNEMRELYSAGNVELRVGARVTEVEHAGNVATGVRWIENGAAQRASGSVVALGANAIFNPYLLLRSGLDGPEVGRGIVEQVSVNVDVHLGGVEAFDGSTVISAIGYPLHDGPDRSRRAAAVIECHNAPVRLRDEHGKWRQRMGLVVVFEDLRQPGNRVTVSKSDPERPEVTFSRYSDYALAGVASLPEMLPRALAPLPVEWLEIGGLSRTVYHIQSSTPMGTDAATSVVDADLRHHRLRNLLVLGASVFPTSPPANPTLTLSALSLRAADRLFA